MDQTQLLLVIGFVFLLAGTVKGLIGLGLPTISVGLLALVLPPAEAAALLLLPSLLTNIAQASGPELWPLLRRLWPTLLAILPGTLLGSFVIVSGDAALPALGVALLAYAGWGLATPPLRLPERVERRGAVPVGLATGLVTGATGVFVIPAVPWLAALGLSRDGLVQALGLGFLTATLALAAGLAMQGSLSVELAGGSALAIVPAMAGQWLGTRLRGRLSATTFRRIFYIALLALGAQLAWRGIA
jgi:uncharacterized membrane protein YfcA